MSESSSLSLPLFLSPSLYESTIPYNEARLEAAEKEIVVRRSHSQKRIDPLFHNRIHTVDWLEEQLSSFCESQGCSVEEVFEKLKECLEGEESPFLPTFMKNTEYSVFLEQMSLFANEKKVLRATQKAATSRSAGTPVNISGHWVVDQSFAKVHRETAEEFMEVTGCPWIYRKIFKHAATSKYLNLYIEQNGDKSIRFVYRFKFFGGTDMVVKIGEENDHKNLWNEMVRSKLWIDEEAKTIEIKAVTYPKKWPKGAKGYATWKMDKDRESMVYVQRCVLKSGEEYAHEQHFTRVHDEDEDDRKGRTSK